MTGNNGSRRKNRTLRQTLTLFAIRVLIVPLVIFSVIMQVRVWMILRQSMEENISQELKTSALVLHTALGRFSASLDSYGGDDMAAVTEYLNAILSEKPAMENSHIYICQGDTVIASSDTSMTGALLSRMPVRGYRVLSLEDEQTGWTIYDYYSLHGYDRELLLQTLIWIFCLGVIGLFGFFMLRQFVRPVLAKVDEMVEAMQRMEEGDFSVRLSTEEEPFEELSRISEGFNEMAGQVDSLIEESRHLLLEQKNAELSALEAQIDPHFLYNTLDTINWTAIGNNDFEVSRMIGDLSGILQYSIRNPGDTITLREEFEWLGHYIALQRKRLSHDLDVELSLPKELENYRIHKLLLQPFVENAIKYGLRMKDSDGRLIIRVRLSGSQLHIEITDNGAGMSPNLLNSLNHPKETDSRHLGIANVRDRLHLYYGGNAGIYFESEEGSGTTVHLFVSAIS